MAEHTYRHLYRVSAHPSVWTFGRRLPEDLRTELRWLQGFVVLVLVALGFAAAVCASAWGLR